MQEIYISGDYLRKNATWHTEDSSWKARQILKGLNACRINPDTVCEVGCGAGEVLSQLYGLLPSHIRFTGYDISPQAFTLCRGRQKDRLAFINEDFVALTSKKFDVLLAIDVFEHIPDYFGFLKALKNRADYKIFHIPLELTAKNLFFGGTLLGSRRSMGHLHYFDRGTALAALEDCGYRILNDFYTYWEGELPHRTAGHGHRFLMRCLKLWNVHAAVRILGGHSLLVVAQ